MVKSLSDINEQAIHVLAREMGIADMLRFLRQFTTGLGNYTEERRELFKDLTLEDITAAAREKREP